MIKIIKRGRWGYFKSELPKKLECAIFNRLSYQKEGWEVAVKMKRMQASWSWVRFYDRRKRRFPWGLIYRVRKILQEWKTQKNEAYQIMGDGITDIGITTKDKGFYNQGDIKGLRPYQTDAINSLISKSGGIVAIPTGGGKTLTTIEFLKKANFFNALVVVTTRDLLSQWEEELIDINNSKDKVVQVKTYQSLISKKNKIDMADYDIVIFDECHHCSANSLFRIAMKCSKALLIGLSATPYRAYHPETLKIIAALGEIVYSVSCRELIKLGYLSDAEIRIDERDYSDDIEVEYWDDYHDIVNKFITNNEPRNLYIAGLAEECAEDGTVLILVDKIEHGENILSWYENSDTKAVFVHGSSKNRKQIFDDVKADKYQVVIASKIYGEGVNFPNLKTLILAGGGKSSVATVQKIGRLLRLFPGKDKAIIYDFQDTAKYLKKHFKARYEIYKENKFEVRFI